MFAFEVPSGAKIATDADIAPSGNNSNFTLVSADDSQQELSGLLITTLRTNPNGKSCKRSRGSYPQIRFSIGDLHTP
jgi:hypothetical protein